MNGFLQSGVFGLPLNEAAAQKQIREREQRKTEKTLGAKLARESAARMTGREADINVLSRYVENPEAFLEAHNREQEQYTRIVREIDKGGRR